MKIAEAYFEIYKSLPPKVKTEVFTMMLNEKNPLLAEIEEGLGEVVQMQKGAKPKRLVKDLIKEMRNE
jgi:hypothetical protein